MGAEIVGSGQEPWLSQKLYRSEAVLGGFGNDEESA